MVRWVPLGRRRGLEYGRRCGGRSMVGWQWPLAGWRHRYLSPEPKPAHMMLLLENPDTCWMQSWRLVEFEQNHGKEHMLATGWLVGHGRRAGQRFQAMRIDRPPKGGRAPPPPISPPHSPFFSFHLRQSINIGIGDLAVNIRFFVSVYVCMFGTSRHFAGENCEVFFRGSDLVELHLASGFSPSSIIPPSPFPHVVPRSISFPAPIERNTNQTT